MKPECKPHSLAFGSEYGSGMTFREYAAVAFAAAFANCDGIPVEDEDRVDIAFAAVRLADELTVALNAVPVRD